MNINDIDIGTVRCRAVGQDTYANTDDLIIALQYQINCLYDIYKKSPDFNPDRASIIQGTTDMICNAISDLTTTKR